jgi:hypothetical protein
MLSRTTNSRESIQDYRRERSRVEGVCAYAESEGDGEMFECTTCGREYASRLEAALCADADTWESEDRLVGVIVRSID